MPPKKRRDFSEAHAAIHRLLEEWFELSEEEQIDKRVHAETIVDAYIESAQSKSLELPVRRELGESCFLLAATEGLYDVPEHRDLVRDLLSASEGLEMLSQLPRVIKLRDAAEASLMRQLADEKRRELREPLSDDDIPF